MSEHSHHHPDRWKLLLFLPFFPSESFIPPSSVTTQSFFPRGQTHYPVSFLPLSVSLFLSLPLCHFFLCPYSLYSFSFSLVPFPRFVSLFLIFLPCFFLYITLPLFSPLSITICGSSPSRQASQAERYSLNVPLEKWSLLEWFPRGDLLWATAIEGRKLEKLALARLISLWLALGTSVFSCP